MAYLRAYQYRGDPGFGSWFKRVTTIPKAVRQGIMGAAMNVIGSVPIVGGLVKSVVGAFPGAFPNTPGGGVPIQNTGGPAMLPMPMAPTMPGGGSTAPPAYQKAAGNYSRGGQYGVGRRKKRQVIDLTAVRHAARRLERFTKAAHRAEKALPHRTVRVHTKGKR